MLEEGLLGIFIRHDVVVSSLKKIFKKNCQRFKIRLGESPHSELKEGLVFIFNKPDIAGADLQSVHFEYSIP